MLFVCCTHYLLSPQCFLLSFMIPDAINSKDLSRPPTIKIQIQFHATDFSCFQGQTLHHHNLSHRTVSYDPNILSCRRPLLLLTIKSQIVSDQCSLSLSRPRFLAFCLHNTLSPVACCLSSSSLLLGNKCVK